MLIEGKMSVAILDIVTTPSSTIMIAMTVKVYGRRSARATIHMAGYEFIRSFYRN
jgi:hypothetical protein